MTGVLEKYILFPVRVIGFRVVQVIVQTPAFFSCHGSLNDQIRRDGDVSQFQSVLGDLKVPVIFLNFLQKKLNAALGPF